MPLEVASPPTENPNPPPSESHPHGSDVLSEGCMSSAGRSPVVESNGRVVVWAVPVVVGR